SHSPGAAQSTSTSRGSAPAADCPVPAGPAPPPPPGEGSAPPPVRRRTAERWRRRPWRATSPCQRCAGPRAYRAAVAPDTNAALDIEVAADLGDTAGSEGMFAAIGAPAGRNGM